MARQQKRSVELERWVDGVQMMVPCSSERVAQPASGPVALGRIAERPTERVSHLRCRCCIVFRWVNVGEADRSVLHSMSSLPQIGENSPPADRDDHALRRLRPLARRDLRMARPPAVDLRARKPCLRAR